MRLPKRQKADMNTLKKNKLDFMHSADFTFVPSVKDSKKKTSVKTNWLF